jgi:hypothetical protein
MSKLFKSQSGQFQFPGLVTAAVIALLAILVYVVLIQGH